jgi:hypothetical protein
VELGRKPTDQRRHGRRRDQAQVPHTRFPILIRNLVKVFFYEMITRDALGYEPFQQTIRLEEIHRIGMKNKFGSLEDAAPPGVYALSGAKLTRCMLRTFRRHVNRPHSC